MYIYIYVYIYIYIYIKYIYFYVYDVLNVCTYVRINYVDQVFLEWDKSIQKPYPYHYTWKCNSSELSGYIYLSIDPSIYLPIYRSIYLSISLSICNYVYIQPQNSRDLSPTTYLHPAAHSSARLLRQKPQRRGGFGLHQQDEADVLQQFQLRLRDLRSQHFRCQKSRGFWAWPRAMDEKYGDRLKDIWCGFRLDGYGSIPMKIPFLMGWTSINPSYFWGSLGTRVLTHPQISDWLSAMKWWFHHYL